MSYFFHTIKQYSFKQLLKRLVEEYIWWIVRNWPGYEGMLLRYWILKLLVKKIDGMCYISQGCTITNCTNITIGRNFACNRNVIIDGTGGLTIGDDVGFGPNSVLLTHEHTMFTQKGYFVDQDYKNKLTIIGNNVWISSNCFLKAGVKIGDNVVIAANSHLVDDAPNNSKWIGNPAKNYYKVMREHIKK